MNTKRANVLPFQERLRGFREKQSLSRKFLAERIGVSEVTVLRWENGSARPNQEMAARLQAIGFGHVARIETNIDEIPRIRLGSNQLGLFGGPDCHENASLPQYSWSVRSRKLQLAPSPYVMNGPQNQASFFEQLYGLQGVSCHNGYTIEDWADRLSAVMSVPGTVPSTSQYRLEEPKKTAAHWNPNYGSHGWHRYIGRFPPHLVRALLNHFHATKESMVCDPFSGSGTTLVECRLLGIPAMGIEICPLSALMSRVKSTFPLNPDPLRMASMNLDEYYQKRWNDFVQGRNIDRISHSDILSRKGNLLDPFPNHERWLTQRALLGVSIVLEYAKSLTGFTRDAVLLALSSKMRSIGNVDVDVARAEYSRQPRSNVDVAAHMRTALARMSESILASALSHKMTIGQPNSIRLLQDDVLSVKLPRGCMDIVITSPPYGVESSSYLRSHLLSYRCLHSFLREDPYQFGDRVIGTEYVSDRDATKPDGSIGAISPAFQRFFGTCLKGNPPTKIVNRAYMMMQFFADMGRLASQLALWLRRGGKVAFVVGNKRIGEYLVPTDKIITEIFEHHALHYTGNLQHKLKCNNTNSQVPWQERVIQDEFILFFSRK